MVFQNDIVAGASGATGGYPIDQSIRFDSSANSYMTRTPSSTGDQKTWTTSFWFKRCSTGVTDYLMTAGNTSINDGIAAIYINSSDDTIHTYFDTSGSNPYGSVNSRKFRDPSAWYHLIWAVDAANTVQRIWVNGEELTLDAAKNPPNFSYDMNASGGTKRMSFGSQAWGFSQYANIYAAEIHHLDGQYITDPTTFGEYDDNGVWRPIEVTGLTYGTNGFYITGADSADLGADESGNGNDFTTSGLTASDQIPDSPTDNYCTFNSLTGVNSGSSVVTQANGNLEATQTANYVATFGTLAVNSGKYYFEYSYAADLNYNDGRLNGGVVCVDTADHGYFRIDGGSFYLPDRTTEGNYMIHHLNGSGQLSNTGSSRIAYNTSLSSASATGGPESGPDIYMVALDLDNNNIYWGKNGTWYGSGSTSGSAYTDATPAGILATHQGKYFAPAFWWNGAASGTTTVLNCGQDATFGGRYSSPAGDFYYTPPTGFSALSTANLPAPTVADGSKYFNSYLWTGNGAGQRIASFQPITETYTIDYSARFNDDDSPRLTKTLGTATDNTAYTVSFWLKRGTLDTAQYIFSGGTSGTSTEDFWRFETSNKMGFRWAGTDRLITSQTFEDASTWYHLVLAVDFNASGSDKAKLYVNGAEVTAFDTDSRSSLSVTNVKWNQAENHTISGFLTTGGSYFDGYLSDFNFIDGQQLTPSSFGQYDSSTNRWIPKAYSGSYGTNGFFLEFGDSAALGDDTSGNTNDFTSSGLASTDQMLDTPTKNYATLDPNGMSSASGVTLKDGNLNADATATATDVNSTLYVTSDKWYVEYTINAVDSSTPSSNPCVGIQTQSFATSPKINIDSTGSMTVNGTTTSLSGFSFTTSDIVMIAFDMDADKFWIGKNGTWYNSGDPGAGTGETTSFSPGGQAMTPFIRSRGASDVTINFGQSAFSHTAPTGFNQLNTDNLPLTGGNISAFSWIKSRSSALSHQLYDRVRGAGYRAVSNSTGAEYYDYDGLQEFLIDGFQLGSSTSVNTDGATYVGWNWMTDTSGSGSTNEDGTITSTVLADTTAGFSIVSWTATGTGSDTIGHGLGVQPSMVIKKERNAVDSWFVQNINYTDGTYSQFLEGTQAQTSSNAYWNSTFPTSSVFSQGTVMNNTNTCIAYCFAEVDGFSKFGTYTGNGNAAGPFVWTGGMTPRWIMIKGASSTGYWMIYDTLRDPFNPNTPVLFADLSNAETSSYDIDVVSNGFKLRTTNGNVNASGVTFVYMAFAEHPFGGTGVAPVPAR